MALVAAVLSLTACGGGSDYVGPTSPTPQASGGLSAEGLSSVSLVPVELRRVQLTGGRQPYTVTSQNTAVVLASVSDATLSLAAVQSHPVPISVVIADASNNRISLAVTVANTTGQGSFSLSPERISVAPGNTTTVNLVGGTPPFTALASNSALVAVSTSGAVLAVGGLQETTETLVRVVDSQGLTRSLPVTVAATGHTTGNAPLFVNLPVQTILSPLSSRTFTIGGGVPPYSVISSQAAVVNPSLRGAALVLQTGQNGTAQLSISDAAGASLSYNIQVQQSGLTPLSLSATEFMDEVGAEMTVWISGGRPPYRLQSANDVVNGVIKNGNVLSLELANMGNGQITVYDADFNQVVMTVIAEKTALATKFALSPAQVTISESLTVDASGNRQATIIPLRVTKAEPPISVFSSHPNLLMPTVNGTTIEVRTPIKDGKPVPACVDKDTEVSISIIDRAGQGAISKITIKDNGPCTS